MALAISAAELRFDGAPGLFVREAMPGDIGLLMQIAAEMIPWKFGRSLERVGQYVAQTFLDYQAARTGSFNIFIGEYWGEVAGGIITAADPDSGGALISLLVVKRIYAGQRGREHAREKQCRVVAQRRI